MTGGLKGPAPAGKSRSIVHVIARLNMGGAALHVCQLAAAQRRRGDDALVIAGTIPEGEESMEYLIDELDLPFRKIPELRRDLSLRSDSKAVQTLRLIFRDYAPDVVHTHTAKAGATGRAAALTLRKHRPRVLLHTYHGHVLSGYFSRPRSALYRTIEKALARGSCALIAVSPQVRDDLVGMGIAPRDKFTVIPYGFDLSDRLDWNGSERAKYRTRIGATDSTFVVGWVGRMAPVKRPLDLVRTLRALVDRGVDASLCLIGDGPQRAETEERARSLDVADRCYFAGYQKQLAGWYSAFDALCLTSANEGTPVSAIEALAAGRPVVATSVGGLPALVNEGETGYLAAPGDTHSLARFLAELAADPDLRQRMGKQGAERIRTRYSTDRMVNEVEELYERCLRAGAA